MKAAFLTETQYQGKWPKNFTNIRTEIAWQHTLDSDHFNIHDYKNVSGYDVVFIIFPKALNKLNMVGIEMEYTNNQRDCDNIKIYELPVTETLKQNNKIVCYIQEGPVYVFNDYEVLTQFNFYNQLANCDIIFAHNAYDTKFYKGMFPGSRVEVIPTLMGTINIPPSQTENKAIIGGNFCYWYGGFQSYIVASEFECPLFAPSMHCKRRNEHSVPNLTHLPYMDWTAWVGHLTSYKYAVHLMPTVAAGTFSLNCAAAGVPCIGNEKIDTQSTLFPKLSVDVNDISTARTLALQLRDNREFYEEVCQYSLDILQDTCYVDKQKWLKYMTDIINRG